MANIQVSRPVTGGYAGRSARLEPRPAPKDFGQGFRPAYAENDPLDHFPSVSAPLDPIGEITTRGKTNSFRHSIWGYEKLEASGPRKPGKISGKSSFFPEILPGFPRTRGVREGGFAAGPEAQRRKLAIHLQVTAGTNDSHQVKQIPLLRDQGPQAPGRRSGGGQPPAFPLAELQIRRMVTLIAPCLKKQPT